MEPIIKLRNIAIQITSDMKREGFSDSKDLLKAKNIKTQKDFIKLAKSYNWDEERIRFTLKHSGYKQLTAEAWNELYR